ncbi:coiled-coil domain-containing protein 154 isoform X8 [Oryctolagus cuniculus]|uniref:coiled-coil domain-containing protein 154 isoform X8 n=1 Tax=Oryctolagus cuniculus TaxID=9986 RepID=UPI00387A2B2A
MSGAAAQGELPRRHLVELAASPPSESLPSRPSTPTMEDLELLLASPEPLSRGETEQRGSSRPLVSSASRPEQDTAKRWQQLERQVADLQAEVARLRGHKERCERASLSLLRDLELQRAAQTPEKAALEVSAGRAAGVGARGPSLLSPAPSPQLHGPHNQMQALDRRLVEVREALTEVRRRQALQDAERKGAEQEARVRLAKLTSLLRQEEQAREAACSTLQKGQEDSSQRVDQEVARMQAQVTTLGEEMSLRFLKREAKLCGFLQRSFLALEQRMKASEGARLQAEGSLRQELDGRWQKLQEQSEERAQAQREQEGGRLLAQCRGLDAAVVQLTKFVRQNQVSLNRVLLAEQKARDAKVCLEESQAGELASHVQESLQAVQLAGQRAQQETQGALELVRGRAGLAGTPIPGRGPPAWASSPVFPTAPREEPGPGAGRGRAGPAGGRPGCPLPGPGLQAGPAGADAGAEAVGSADRMGGGREEVPAGPGPVAEGGGRAAGGAAGQSRQPPPAGGHGHAAPPAPAALGPPGLPRASSACVAAPFQVEGVSDKCFFHKRDSDLKIAAEGEAREQEVGAVRQELAALLSSVQLLKEDNPGRKIAEIQGKLATFQSQMVRLGDSVQAHRTVQNLKLNAEAKLRTEEVAALRETVLRLWSEEGPWALTLGSRRLLMSLVRQRFFVKDVGAGELAPVNQWGVYQAVRWLRWKAVLMTLGAPRRPGRGPQKSRGREPAVLPPRVPPPQK